MRKLFLLGSVIVTLAIVLTSCSYFSSSVPITEPASVSPGDISTTTGYPSNSPYYTTPTTTGNTDNEVVPTSTVTVRPVVTTPIEIKTKDDLLQLTSDLVYPIDVQIQNCLKGYTYNLWTNNDTRPVLGHGIGDVLGIRVYNCHDQSAIFSISYRDITEKNTYSQTGITYSPAPPSASDWITIKYAEANLLPHELATIPLSFTIPVNATASGDWEFLIVVQDKTFSGNVNTAASVRFLVSMQR
jgi:hypothetical protein